MVASIVVVTLEVQTKFSQGKACVDFKFRTIDPGDNLTIAQSTNALTINVVDSPEFGNLKINSAANTI